jgi:hypothetical protein
MPYLAGVRAITRLHDQGVEVAAAVGADACAGSGVAEHEVDGAVRIFFGRDRRGGVRTGSGSASPPAGMA